MLGTREVVLCFGLFILVHCGYPPIGDEVVPGSVLLPATRRGRYLANIVRRQAVDGTGIKFNKDADRMNAEAKKKVDVLSEELLPYIIAEQERRTTLYKRVMTAIQNGEKGVTIAEIRNKPPLIIRKGLMFRCPTNRAPKEPDGSGVIMCEKDVEPTPIMFDSCLSAEDKDLYIAENKYFFCNRHRTEGADLPRNGSTVIPCAPAERTSLNYTSTKCALEDTSDVVVHYRYYPDRTYKFVTELDPDHEVCDNWNPCQIGYIYSLPTQDQAIEGSEFWREYVDGKFEEYEKIVPPIAEDFKTEHVPVALASSKNSYEISKRINVPKGYTFDSISKLKKPMRDSDKIKTKKVKLSASQDPGVEEAAIEVKLDSFPKSRYGQYYAIFSKEEGGKKVLKAVEFVQLEKSNLWMERKELTLMPGAVRDPEILEYRCDKCRIQGVTVRTDDGNVYNLDSSRWSTVDSNDGSKRVQITITGAKPKDIGTYYMRFQADDGNEEIIQSLRLTVPEKVLKAPQYRHSGTQGEKIDHAITYSCDNCEPTDVTCNGESAVTSGKVSIVTGVKMISFNIPSFENSDACVYMVSYKHNNLIYSKALAVIENASPSAKVEVATVTAPKENEPFEKIIDATCDNGDCQVSKVSVNGISLETGPTRRMDNSPTVYYRVASSKITIYMSSYSDAYEGVFQAVFEVNDEAITKNILEIKGTEEKEAETAAPPAEEETTAAPEAHADDATEAATGEHEEATAVHDAATADPAAETTEHAAESADPAAADPAAADAPATDAPAADAPAADAPATDAPAADAPATDAPAADAPAADPPADPPAP